MIHIGFLMNRILPKKPMYLERQPAAHILTAYSTPKNTTKQISWKMKRQNFINIFHNTQKKYNNMLGAGVSSKRYCTSCILLGQEEFLLVNNWGRIPKWNIHQHVGLHISVGHMWKQKQQTSGGVCKPSGNFSVVGRSCNHVELMSRMYMKWVIFSKSEIGRTRVTVWY